MRRLPHRPLPPWPVTVILAAVTAGCALAQSTETGSLAGACQFRPCECVRAGASLSPFAEVKPVEWLINGDATCPDGFRLRLASR